MREDELLRRENYEAFLEEFKERLGEGHLDVCFYVYGSIYDGKEFVPGISDIDGGLILDSDRVVLDKGKLKDISEILADSLRRSRVDIQFNLLDRITGNDGRFLSYTCDFTEFLRNSAQVLSGPDFISQLNGLDYKLGVLNAAAFNFRRIRNTSLCAYNLFENNHPKFLDSTIESLKLTAKFPIKLVYIRTGELILSRSHSRERLSGLIEGIDLSGAKEVSELIRNPRKLHREMNNKYKAIEWLYLALDSCETMVEAYLREFPDISEREIGRN
ncbi:MAG: hypothetical protein Q8N99_08050 [Nanoarchaeota archaeon]|nr:hypothetical protein [Nanoarchaeota archaeon]